MSGLVVSHLAPDNASPVRPGWIESQRVTGMESESCNRDSSLARRLCLRMQNRQNSSGTALSSVPLLLRPRAHFRLSGFRAPAGVGREIFRWRSAVITASCRMRVVSSLHHLIHHQLRRRRTAARQQAQPVGGVASRRRPSSRGENGSSPNPLREVRLTGTRAARGAPVIENAVVRAARLARR